ncbi:MAG: hypothetical protein J7501_15245 [Bdellovibrio sp.]|nr:hypothetical protein [Bdellovibrio sp.]
MIKFLSRSFLVGLAIWMAACAHEEAPPQDPNAHLKGETFEVSAAGGDEALLRGTAGQEAQTTVSGILQVRGVKQKFVGPLDMHLVDRDGTIYARTKSNGGGQFTLSGLIAPGNYYVRVVAKKYRGEQAIVVDKPTITGVVVRVEAIIR